jgi:hypothetical protein
VARIVRRGALYIGTALNGAEDALDFSEHFDRWITPFVQSSNGWTNPSPAIQTDMSRDLHAILEKHCASLKPETRTWGWKAPRSMYLLPFWHQRFPRFKFLHVVRDGRDIAYSTNQNQLRKHGGVFLTSAEAQWNQPLQSIARWSRINLLIADYGEQKLGASICAPPLCRQFSGSSIFLVSKETCDTLPSSRCGLQHRWGVGVRKNGSWEKSCVALGLRLWRGFVMNCHKE